jgi:plasmid stabilization system protein ParE
VNAPSLKWRARARAEFESLISYIALDNSDAAQELRNEFLVKVGLLPQHPRLYRPGKLPGTREMVVRRNYIVVYVETPETVTVLRVLHAAMQWP